MKSALRFVLLMGIVSMFGDMTYEGGRGEVGAFLGYLGASGLIIGVVAGGGELAGYAIRMLAGTLADRTGKYWLQAWIGYAINLLSVPALALVGSVPAASALVVGERLGRGIRRPVTASFIAAAGKELGGGWAFGLNEALDQFGATVGPLIAAFAISRGGFHLGFGVLVVPAVLTLVMLVPAQLASRSLAPVKRIGTGPLFTDAAAFRRYAIGGALVAGGFVDFALIAYRFGRDHVGSVASISIWFAVAMALAAIMAPLLGKLLDRFGPAIVAAALLVSAVSVPLAFLFSGPLAFAGASLWGIGTAIQDSLLLALVSTVIAEGRRPTAFGLYDLIFGLAWFLGSVVCGVLVDRSPLGLVIFCVALQLLAIPFFIARRKAIPAAPA